MLPLSLQFGVSSSLAFCYGAQFKLRRHHRSFVNVYTPLSPLPNHDNLGKEKLAQEIFMAAGFFILNILWVSIYAHVTIKQTRIALKKGEGQVLPYVYF